MTGTETLEWKQERLEQELQEQNQKINMILDTLREIQTTLKDLDNPTLTVQNGGAPKEMRLYSVIGGLYKNSHEHGERIASIEESLKSFRKVTIHEDDGSNPTFELDDAMNKLWHKSRNNMNRFASFSDNFVKIFTGIQSIALIVIGIIYYFSKKG